MKVLYAIQTTGNGHLSRAKEFIPYLKQRFQVDVILSGPQTHLDLDFPIKKHYRGLRFYYTEKGAVNWLKTIGKNNFWRFFKDVLQQDIQEYDLIITDFEPVSAWSSKLKGVACYGLSNQLSLWQKGVQEPIQKKRFLIRYLKWFAPVDKEYPLHYFKFNKSIYDPIIRSSIRKLKTREDGGILVYLPAYAESSILAIIQQFPNIEWHVFSQKRNDKTTVGSTHLYPLKESTFLHQLANAKGVVTNAGFSTTTEALFLGKPLLVIPIKKQIEQAYNSAALQKIGVPCLNDFSLSYLKEITKWTQNPVSIKLEYKNELSTLVDEISITYIKRSLLNKKSSATANS